MTAVLSVSNLSKTFFGQRVLSEVDLAVDAGEVHGLIGQNGSGKSTLIKVLAGYHAPDPGGEVCVDGKVLAPGSPTASEASGLRFVHQDLGLVESLSTVENLALGPGYSSTRLGLISWSRERRVAEQTLGRLGHDIDVTRPVGELPMASRTAVAVARALSSRSGEPKVVVLDEPTASLPPHETELLLDLLSRVSATGVGVVFVSHHLEEVISACSRVSVLRDGVLVANAPIAGNVAADLVEMMIGQRIDRYDAAPARPRGGPGEARHRRAGDHRHSRHQLHGRCWRDRRAGRPHRLRARGGRPGDLRRPAPSGDGLGLRAVGAAAAARPVDRGRYRAGPGRPARQRRLRGCRRPGEPLGGQSPRTRAARLDPDQARASGGRALAGQGGRAGRRNPSG